MKIIVLGSGSYGTAFASKLAVSPAVKVTVYSRSDIQAHFINDEKTNPSYLDNLSLSKHLSATINIEDARGADALFLALPSGVIRDFVEENMGVFLSAKLVVNLSKGFISDSNETIADYLIRKIHNVTIASVKGPTFAGDMLLSPSSGLTLAATNETALRALETMLVDSGFCVDQATSLREIEYLSILKNVYAIALGIVEAKFNNPNLRAVVFTRCLAEMKEVASQCCGHEANIFLYCGVGDLLLTGLNDQSRNRTFGLMLGKGFIKPGNNIDGPILEGIKSINFIKSRLSGLSPVKAKIYYALLDLMEQKITVGQFTGRVVH